jgi:ATP-dependent 26S proteasome regulatory subunit
MPFTVADLNERAESGAGSVTILNSASANISDFVAIFVNGSALLEVYLGDGTTIQSDSAQQLTASTEIFVSAHYFTA